WEGLFAPHIYFNVAAATPVVGDRTKRYLVIDNLDANDRAVQIGEIVVAGEVETFAGLDVDARAPESFGVAFNPSKKGVKTVHDWRSRDRIWEGHTIVDPGDTAFASLARASRGALPFLCWPEGDMSREPILARLSSPAFERSFVAGPDIYRVPVLIEELSCGEAY